MKTTKELVLERIAQQIDEQTAKGAVKYNQSLEACGLTDYDWQAMQIEELIDGSRYQHMENMRLKEENERLNSALEGLGKAVEIYSGMPVEEALEEVIEYVLEESK